MTKKPNNVVQVSEVRVEDLVEQYFSTLEQDTQKLYLLSEKGMARAVQAFVDKDDKEAISLIIQSVPTVWSNLLPAWYIYLTHCS